eukprot:3316661-Prorocentrum_lima.AAC.1
MMKEDQRTPAPPIVMGTMPPSPVEDDHPVLGGDAHVDTLDLKFSSVQIPDDPHHAGTHICPVNVPLRQ